MGGDLYHAITLALISLRSMKIMNRSISAVQALSLIYPTLSPHTALQSNLPVRLHNKTNLLQTLILLQQHLLPIVKVKTTCVKRLTILPQLNINLDCPQPIHPLQHTIIKVIKRTFNRPSSLRPIRDRIS